LSMKNIMRSILSFAVIGFFLLAAIASFGPDEATNTTVPISDCESKPVVTGNLKVDIKLRTLQLEPIPEHDIQIFVTHQKVNPDTSCTFQSTMSNVILTTDIDGEISWFAPDNFTHDNSEDLYRVQIKVRGDDNWDQADDIQVLKYNQAQFSFYIIQYNKDDI